MSETAFRKVVMQNIRLKFTFDDFDEGSKSVRIIAVSKAINHCLANCHSLVCFGNVDEVKDASMLLRLRSDFAALRS